MAVDVTLTGTNFDKANAKPSLDGTPGSWKGTPTATSGVVTVPTTSAKTVKVTVKSDDGESPSQDFTIEVAGQSVSATAAPGNP